MVLYSKMLVFTCYTHTPSLSFSLTHTHTHTFSLSLSFFFHPPDISAEALRDNINLYGALRPLTDVPRPLRSLPLIVRRLASRHHFLLPSLSSLLPLPESPYHQTVFLLYQGKTQSAILRDLRCPISAIAGKDAFVSYCLREEN